MKFWLPLLVCLAGAAPASAQLMLPGAVGAPPPDGGMGAAPGQPAKPRPKPKPAPPKAASADALIGLDLYLNGRNGMMSFARSGKELSISKLKLAGDLMSRPGERCEVDVVAGGQIALKAEGRPNGAARYGVDLPACPFSVEALDGAALAIHSGGACEFREADCRVEPAGLWGPTPNAFSPARIKEFEKARGRAETSMRDAFKALAAAGRDKSEIRQAASEQAGFSAEREMMCRDYAREDTHGFCALRITEARGVSLRTRLGKPLADTDAPAKPKKKKKPKPAAPAVAPAPMAPGMGGTF